METSLKYLTPPPKTYTCRSVKHAIYPLPKCHVHFWALIGYLPSPWSTIQGRLECLPRKPVQAHEYSQDQHSARQLTQGIGPYLQYVYLTELSASLNSNSLLQEEVVDCLQSYLSIPIAVRRGATQSFMSVAMVFGFPACVIDLPVSVSVPSFVPAVTRRGPWSIAFQGKVVICRPCLRLASCRYNQGFKASERRCMSM